jgi:hypothetical protein
MAEGSVARARGSQPLPPRAGTAAGAGVSLIRFPPLAGPSQKFHELHLGEVLHAPRHRPGLAFGLIPPRGALLTLGRLVASPHITGSVESQQKKNRTRVRRLAGPCLSNLLRDPFLALSPKYRAEGSTLHRRICISPRSGGARLRAHQFADGRRCRGAFFLMFVAGHGSP